MFNPKGFQLSKNIVQSGLGLRAPGSERLAGRLINSDQDDISLAAMPKKWALLAS